MIRTLSALGFCLGGLASTLAASPARPALPAVLENIIVPLARPVRSDADQAWLEIESIIAVTPDLSVARPYPQTKPSWAGYVYVQEAANRALREAGLRFWREHPDDLRVWSWLAATLDRAPSYVDLAQAWRAQGDPAIEPGYDDEARAAWAADFARLREAAIASDEAPETLRIRLWVGLLGTPLDAEMWSRVKGEPLAKPLDFDGIGAGLLALGEKFPAHEGIEVRNLAGQFFRAADRLSPESAAKWRAALREGANEMLRNLAGAKDAVEEARVRPLEMRFTAIDGREVDLANLRGKVVLIDFRGVTWCGACRDQEPYMKEAYAKYCDAGFEIITITYENKPESRDFVAKYVKERGLVWPHYFDGRGADNPFIRRFGIVSVPRHFLLDQQGLLVSTDARGRNLEAEVRKLLARAERSSVR